MKKISCVIIGSVLSISNAYSYQLNNGKIIEASHFINNPSNAIYTESYLPQKAMNTSLGAEADVVKVATNYSYHSTTNHSVYIVNDTSTINTYNWFFESCPQNYMCTVIAGAVQLNPGGSFCESGTLQPAIKYPIIGIYQNLAVTETKGYEERYAKSIAPIQVS